MLSLSISALGGVRITLAGKPALQSGYDKVRALLIYLVMAEGKPQSREALAALLWPEQNPQAARHSLSQATLLLRKAIKDAERESPCIVGDRDTLQFVPPPDFYLDVHEFLARVEKVAEHRHLSEEDCPGCIQLLEEAVALYAGDFLHGLIVEDSADFEEWVVTWRENLHMRVILALQTLSRQFAYKGKYAQAQQYARRQVELEPYREEAHRQLMTILARSGQRSAALAQYQTCCRILAEELGIEPDRETQALYRRILSAGEASPHNLPAALTPLIGRQKELMQVAEILAAPEQRLLTIQGIGGVGKTRLALEAAREHIGVFLHGVFFVPLAAISDPGLIAGAITEALDAPLQRGQSPEEALLAYLRDREVLLVLDNFEHLLDGALLVNRILKHSPYVTVVVTSRERLGLHGETCLVLDGLPVYEDVHPLEDVSPAAALFIASARRLLSDFEFTAERAPHILRICQLTQGIPLLLEMAAAWVPLNSCAQIAEQIAADLDFLSSRRRDLPPRQRSVRAVFEHSWELLLPDEQRQFARLSVFRGSFSLQAAQQVCGASRDVLARLVETSLVQLTAEGRYELHSLLAAFAAEKLAKTPEIRDETRRAHASFFAHFVSSRSELLRSRGDNVALNELEQESENLRVTWEWAVAQREWEFVDLMLDGLEIFYWARNRFGEGQAIFAQALEVLRQAPAGQERLLARLKMYWAECTAWLGNLEQAQSTLQMAIQSLRALQTDLSLVKALNLRGILGYLQGEYDLARVALEEALVLGRELEDETIIASTLSELATLLCEHRADYAAAIPLYQESLRLYQDLGNLHGEASVLLNLGAIAYETGNLVEARHYYEQSLAIYQEIRYPRGLAAALNNLAMVYRSQGNLPEALKLVEESLEIKQQTGNRVAILYSLLEMGALQMAMAEVHQARRTFLEMLQMACEVHATELALHAVLGLAETALETDETDRAAVWLAFVRSHPCAGQEVVRSLNNLSPRVREVLPPAALDKAEHRAPTLTLENIYQEASALR